MQTFSWDAGGGPVVRHGEVTLERLRATSVIDDLWIVLATECAGALNSLVRLQRKQFSPRPDAAELGLPSVGMVAFLLAAGREGLTPAAFAESLVSDDDARRRIANIERTFVDQVSGVRRLYADDVRAIASAAGMSDDQSTRLVERVFAEHPESHEYCKPTLSLDHVIDRVRSLRQRDVEVGRSAVLTSIGAVLRHQAEGRDLSAAKAELHGVVVQRAKYSGGVVLVLSDGLDSINLVVSKAASSTAAGASCVEQDRIRVAGVLGLNRNGVLTVFVEACERIVEGDVIPDKRRLLEELQRHGLPPRVLLGTVVQEMDVLLWERRFTRFEPSIVSSALAPGETVEPLDVYFPGLGGRTSLVPSPAPQLIRAAIGLGIPRLYATSRIITRAIRDGYTSPDSPTTFVLLLNVDLQETLTVTEDLIWSLLGRLLDDKSRRRLSSEPPWDSMASEYADSGSSTDAHHRVFPRIATARGFDVTPFTTTISDRIDVAEGHVAHISRNVQYAVVSLQEERVLQLLTRSKGSRLVQFQGPESVLMPEMEP